MPIEHTLPPSADPGRMYHQLAATRDRCLASVNAVPEAARADLLEHAAQADEALRKARRALVHAFHALAILEARLPCTDH